MIPSSMATQHPDNAGKPFWHSKPFISTSAEITESFICFSDYDIDEYNWDWEGKFVDEAVVDRLLHKHFAYFQKHHLGSRKFLTFRIPNPRVEKQFRLARAFMVIITSSQLAQSLGFADPPIFETILPLTETAHEIIEIQKAYRDLVSIDHRLLQMEDSLKHIQIIPLFEQIDKIIDSDKLLRQYIGLHKKTFGSIPEYIRPYCARSDPALNSGLVPTMWALKIALSQYERVEQDTGVRMFPMVGTGSLPFRGSVVPDDIERVVDEYAGIKTLILQSAFRYDYPASVVKQAIAYIRQHLQKKKTVFVSKKEKSDIQKIIPAFEKPYQHTIEMLAPLINQIAHQIPRRRERVQHIGLFGYSRGIGSVSLPRAISFTAALYSVGLPPELIGTGLGIKHARKRKMWDRVSHIYKYMKSDLIRAGYFLNRENVKLISDHFRLGGMLFESIDVIEKELKIQLGPITKDHHIHHSLTETIYKRVQDKKKVTPLISYSGSLRKSLG